MTTTISPACLLLDALTAAGIRTACDFDPADLSVRDPECFARLVSNAAYFLSAPVAEGLEDECPDDDEAEESAPDAFEPLSLEIYRAGRARLRFPLLDFRVARRPTAEKLPDIYRW